MNIASLYARVNQKIEKHIQNVMPLLLFVVIDVVVVGAVIILDSCFTSSSSSSRQFNGENHKRIVSDIALMLCALYVTFGSHALTDEVEMKREFLLYLLVCTMSWKTITGLHYVII